MFYRSYFVQQETNSRI